MIYYVIQPVVAPTMTGTATCGVANTPSAGFPIVIGGGYSGIGPNQLTKQYTINSFPSGPSGQTGQTGQTGWTVTLNDTPASDWTVYAVCSK